jgi:DNA-binding CsgD family transcriptional regulator
MPSNINRIKEKYILFSLIIIISLSTLIDIIVDYNEGIPLSHILHEVILLGLCAGMIYFQARMIFKREQALGVFSSEIERIRKEKREFKQKVEELSGNFSKILDEQLSTWGLSEGEKDVAKLLIKGFSMKEIAEFRHSHESTVRQQATAIYKKSGVAGRQELAAFFLEDLF